MSVYTWDGSKPSTMGTSGYSINKPYKPLTCPGGYYVSRVEGNEWDGSVGYISAITCTNYLDPSKTVQVQGAVGYPNPGNKGDSSPYQSFDCGPAGLTGVLFSSGTILDSVYPICGPDKDASMRFDTRGFLIGANANWPHLGKANSIVYPQWCQLPGKPAGVNAFVTELNGQNPTAYEGRISSANFKCKDFTDIDAVKRSPDRMADVCNGSDPLTSELITAIPCSSYMKHYCSGSLAWSDRCTNYYSKNPNLETDIDDNKFAFCSQGDNYTDPKCLSFCDWQGSGSGDPDARPAYKSRCNDLYTRVCKGKTSDLCSCLNKPNLDDWAGDTNYAGLKAAIDSSKGASTKPQCYFSACRDKGYKIFANQTPSVNCPTCLNYVGMSTDKQAQASIGNVIQQCTAGVSNSTSATSQTSSADSTTTTVVIQAWKEKIESLPSWQRWCIYALGLACVILLVTCVLGFFLGGSSSDDDVENALEPGSTPT